MTSVHGAFDIRIFHKECKSLANAGYDVTLIAPHNEATQVVDGIKLHTVEVPRSRKERLTKTISSVYKAALEEKADIYHFHDPELMPVGVLLKLHSKRVLYDVHEDYGSNMNKHWIPPAFQGAASSAVRLSEATLGRACDRIVAATPKIAEKFDPAMTSLVQNFPWLDEFSLQAGDPYADREPIVAYVGYLADSRGWMEMNSAIKLVAKSMPAKLVFAGGVIGGTTATSSVEEASLIEHLGIVDRHQVGALLARSRVGLVVYHPTANYLHGQPTKLLEYMAAGLPVVASHFPFYKRVIEGANCGIVVDPLNPVEIANAIKWLLQNKEQARAMGENGRDAVRKLYNWERESMTLLDTYANL